LTERHLQIVVISKRTDKESSYPKRIKGEKMENRISRRLVLKTAVIGSCYSVACSSIPMMAWADGGAIIEHPMMKPKKYTDKGRCPNCGMNLNMWARTRHEFKNSEGEFATCSIRCLADMSVNSNEKAKDVKVALYLHPEKMIPAEQASYLIGSSAKGTMTMKSKIAFESKGAAEEFAAKAGGKLVNFNMAQTMATKELTMSRPKIEAKRKKKGKIEDPGSEERCPVCEMYPARYPEFRCQLTTVDGKRHHFCSTQCLLNFKDNPKKYVKDVKKIKSIWVTVFPDGDSEYAMGLHYLVGSSIMGPMGKEALPYRNKAAAMKSAKENGGKVVRFNVLNSALVMGK